MSHPRRSWRGQDPRLWLGVKKDWQVVGDDPLQSLARYERDRHIYVIGRSGSGKSVLIQTLMAHQVLLSGNFIVLDMRGDHVRAAIEICSKGMAPARVKVLDLRDRRRPLGFDPLYGKGEPYFRALNVLQVVESLSESWGVQLSESLRYGLLLLAETGERLTRLEDLFHERSFLLRCLDKSGDDKVVGFWQRYDALSPEKKAALAAPVLNKVSLILAPSATRKVLGHPTPLDLSRHLNTPGSVLLCSFAVDETSQAGIAMSRLVLKSVLREIFARTDIPESRRVPVTLFVDEWESFGFQEFEEVLAEGRRFKLTAVLAHQTLSQIPAKTRSIVLANAATIVALGLGRSDSAAMSRELTGDPKAIDFNSFAVGHAVVWSREAGPVEVELNGPVVPDVGGLSVEAQRFARRVAERNGDPAPERPTSRAEPEPQSDPKRRRGPAARSAVEDWLCD